MIPNDLKTHIYRIRAFLDLVEAELDELIRLSGVKTGPDIHKKGVNYAEKERN